MEFSAILQSILALVFVLGLIGVTTFIIKRYGGEGVVLRQIAKGEKGKRLAISDVVMIDQRRRLVLVKRDNVEHLILLGPDRETVVESNIKKAVKKR